MVTVIIPSRTEDYLGKTVKTLLDRSVGEVSVIVNLDGYMPKEPLKDGRVTYIHNSSPIGMRGGINNGLKMAKSKYIMKIDDHCVFAEGWDEAMTKHMQEDWLMVPRRYSMHLNNWDRDIRFHVKDYHYLTFPQMTDWGLGLYPQEWKERSKERFGKPEFDIDDTMTFQGSCWMADREYFMKNVGLLDEENYSTFSQEQVEIGMKYWLGGGAIKVNKHTWYAHLFKNLNYYKKGRRHEKSWKKDLKEMAGNEWSAKHWMNDEEPNTRYNMEWFINKFWPVPSWPDNWKEVWNGKS